MVQDLNKLISKILPEITDFRRDLHAHPELGYEEVRTAGKVLEFLKDAKGLEIRQGVAKTGLVITLGKDKAGPCVALRADMDALPMDEFSGVEWSSTVPGKMHACGHDGHTAMLAGAVRVLSEIEDELAGPVKFIFQPAEEGGAGGLRMCQEGALKNPDAAAIFGLHNNLTDYSIKAGSIAYCPGPAMAGTGTFEIEVIGKGGHAAYPHNCIDPLYIGACMVEQLQGVVSRIIDPVKAAVVSVTQFNAGSALNIIAERAKLAGTFRALDMDILEQLRTSIEDRVQGVAQAHGAEVKIKYETGYPVLVNSEIGEKTFRSILEETGDLKNLHQVSPVMGGEDFAFFAGEIPGFFYYLPACPVNQESIPMCHHPAFDFNDELLPLGIRLHVETARRFASNWKQ